MDKDNSSPSKIPDAFKSSRDQIALVLAASSPPNIETVETLASFGSHLALHHKANERPDAIVLFEKLSSRHPGLHITMHSSDLSSPSAIDALFAEVLAKHGKIDLVVNGAGNILQKPIAQLSEAERAQLLAYHTFVGEQGQDYSRRLREELDKRRRAG